MKKLNYRDFGLLGLGTNGALFLSQALYWTSRTKDEDGWFYKTLDKIAEDLQDARKK